MRKVLGGIEKSLDAIKLKINQIKRELLQLEESNKPMPELINSTNLLRSNEILSKTNEKKTELLSAYESYFHELEITLKKIQNGLRTLKTTKKTRKKRIKIKKKTKRKSVKRRKTRIRKKSRRKNLAKRKR